jgi:Ca2+-binding RTX toxin-like protein
MGGSDNDLLVGGLGHDILTGGLGADILDGGEGFDLASYAQSSAGVVANLSNAAENTGEAAGDNYYLIEGFEGSACADELTGSNMNNELYGNGGNDTLEGRGGADWLFGGAGFDFAGYVHAAAGGVVANLTESWRNAGAAAGDRYLSIEGLIGSAHNDVLGGSNEADALHGGGGRDDLQGLWGHDSLYGGEGMDFLTGGVGSDVLDGGSGYDFACYGNASTGVLVNLSGNWHNTGEAAGDLLLYIEGLHGSAHADVLTGASGYNEIYGHLGDDQLFGLADGDFLSGGDGHDLLVGGAGNDHLVGGNGSDIIRFDAVLGASNVDVVEGFVCGSDKLQLSRGVFTAFTSQGAVNADQFTIGTSATSAAHRLVYNSGTGAVFYDADGVGGAAQVQFATVSRYLPLKATDFALIWV